jgi:hypothetical protein
MINILEDLERFIEAEVATPVTDTDTNVGDAPVEEDLTIKISFGDLKDDIQSSIKEKLLKSMNASDDISKNNLVKILNTTPIFDGTVEAFKNQVGIENK